MPITVETTIARPPRATWDALTDIDRFEERLGQVARVERVAGEGFAVGTRWRETRSMHGREATEELEVVLAEPTRRYEVVSASAGTSYRSILTLEPVGEAATRVRHEFDARARTVRARLLSPLGWLFRPAVRRMLQRDLDDLRASLTPDGA